MQSSPTARFRVVSSASTFVLSGAAWIVSSAGLTTFRPGAGMFFAVAACLSAAIGGMPQVLIAILLNVAALNLFAYFYQPEIWGTESGLWSILLVVLPVIVGYARQKSSAAQALAGHLRNDLALMRDELESQRADLKRFHDLSMRLSSSLEPRRWLNDVLNSIASLQKTDLALLLLLPEKSSKVMRVETSTGFTTDQIKLFGEFTTSFFSPNHRVLIEDIEKPGACFPFVDAATQVGFRGVFSMPVNNANGEPRGVVVTFFRRQFSPNERQTRLVELYARQAANALDNARVYRDSLDTLAVEQRRSALLRSLAEASVQINSAHSLDSLLQTITDQARNIIGAGQAFTTLLAKGGLNQSMTCFSVAEGQPVFDFPEASSEMFMLACTLNKPVRLNAGSEGNRPWRSINKQAEAARRGWLAAPLLTRDGRNLGLIQLSDKLDAEFSADDEVLLVQLAHMASVAIDNVRLYRESQEQLAETRRTQEALERSKETMQLAQQCVGIGIWEWDLVTGALAWSDEIRHLHGFFAGDFDGRYESWMESIHPEDRHQVRQAVTEAIAANSEYEVQYRVVFADHTVHWLEGRGRTMVLGNAPLRMLCVAIDISARKQAEEALRASEKLAATGRLAAAIAHEINNPLAAVTNVLYILRTNPHLVGAGLDYVKTAEAELARVVHITKQTLGFYRELAASVMTSVPGLLEEVLSTYDSNLEKNSIHLHKRCKRVWQLRGFPGELRQVFSNLIANAVEAAPTGGVVSVRVRQAHNGRGGYGIRVTVADNGAGIAKENMRKLFEPFFSTKDAKGAGLGLWVSQGIVQKHGGTIHVRSSISSLHHGTCFVVFLPFSASLEDTILNPTVNHSLNIAQIVSQNPPGNEAPAANGD